MAAIKMDGTVLFEGQVVNYDIDEFGTPNSWTLGEMYFVTAELDGYRGLGNPAYKYTRHYVNEHIAMLDGRPVTVEEVRRLYGGTYGIVYQRVPVYKNVTVDAQDALKELYQQHRDAERMFRHTLVKFAQLCEPKLNREVNIVQGRNKGHHGPIVDMKGYRFNDVTVMFMGSGETVEVSKNYLKVINPMQYLEAPVACLDCHNVFTENTGDLRWVIGDGWNRPVCGYCRDYYMEKGTMNFETSYNVEGPYEYTEDQFASSFIEPGVLPLHRVLSEQGSLRTPETRRTGMHPSGPYRRGRRW